MKEKYAICLLSFSLFFSLLLLPLDVYATKLGVRVTSGFWGARYQGYVIDQKNVTESINLKDDLNLSNSLEPFFYVYLEHPNPKIPNIRIGKSKIRTTGINRLTKIFTYQNTVYAVNEDISSTFNLDHIEATLYWKVINTKNRMDLGFTVKDFTGQITVVGSVSGTAEEHLEVWIPLIYVGYETDLPLTAFTMGINSSFLGVDDNTYLYDLIAYFQYQTYSYVGLEFGYRAFKLKLNNDVINTNVKITGFYLNGFIRF